MVDAIEHLSMDRIVEVGDDARQNLFAFARRVLYGAFCGESEGIPEDVPYSTDDSVFLVRMSCNLTRRR